jgi:hypothetical protein
MSGMINGAPPAAGAAQTTNQMSSPILEAAEQKIEEQLAQDDQNKQNYQKIVVAGMAAALSRGPDGILASLRKSPDPVRDAAKGAVSLVLILRRNARGVMPLKAMVPAAMTLMLRALDFVNRTGTKIGTPELVRATHIFTNEVFAAFHITPAMLAHASTQVHALTQDPVAMAAINQKAGITQHPNAANPTPMPPS